MKILKYSFIILILVHIDIWGQWEEIHLADTSYIVQADAYNSVLGVKTSDDKTFISLDSGDSWQNVSLSDTNLNNYVDKGTNFFKLFGKFYVKKNGTWYQMFAYFPFDEAILVDTTLIRIQTYGGLHGSYQVVSRGSINNYSLINYSGNNYFQVVWTECLTDIPCHTLLFYANNIYLASSNGIYLSSDFGISWNQIGLKNEAIRILVLSNTNLIAETYNGFFKSLDGGYNWSAINLGLDNIDDLKLCGDNLIAITKLSYQHYRIWKRPFNDVITNIKEKQVLPDKYSLSQNYPNPFNPTTKIKYDLPKSGHVILKVYDILGRELTTLVNEEKPAGSYEVRFNGSNLSSGIYFYKIQAGDYTSVKKMVLIK